MKNKWYINIWNEGKYVDFWSFNHLFAGAVVANLFIYFNGSFWIGLIIVASLEAGWEMFEIASTRIHETMENRVVDVIITISGYVINYFVLQFALIKNSEEAFVLILMLIILSIWGYLASKQKPKLNKV